MKETINLTIDWYTSTSELTPPKPVTSILYDTVVPSVVKKFASGKGNADKQLMYDSFIKHTKQDLLKMFDMGKLNNPVTDIVDSYYIAKVGYENSSSY